MTIFGTLGGDTSNHAFILSQYLRKHGLDKSSATYYDDFFIAFDDLIAGSIDRVLQVSVHPQHADCVARYVNRAFIIDTFIAASKPLGIVTRKDVNLPQSIALQKATRHYTDLSTWTKQIEETSTSTVAEGLMDARFDSGLTTLDLVDRYPERFRIDRNIGAIEDVWVLFGRDRSSRRNALL